MCIPVYIHIYDNSAESLHGNITYKFVFYQIAINLYHLEALVINYVAFRTLCLALLDNFSGLA